MALFVKKWEEGSTERVVVCFGFACLVGRLRHTRPSKGKRKE